MDFNVFFFGNRQMENLSFVHVPDSGNILTFDRSTIKAKWLSNIPHPQYSIFVKGECTDALMLGKASYSGQHKVPPANVLNLLSVCHFMFCTEYSIERDNILFKVVRLHGVGSSRKCWSTNHPWAAHALIALEFLIKLVRPLHYSTPHNVFLLTASVGTTNTHNACPLSKGREKNTLCKFR